MKAIVCDKCGKVILLPDEASVIFPKGVTRLVNTTTRTEIDLCEECADELMAAVQKEK